MARTEATLEFQAVHDGFRSRILRYLTRLVGEGEAEDLTQSVMLKISEGLPHFRGESTLSTWIYRVATNAAIDRIRRKTIPSQVLTEAELDEADAPPEAQAASVEKTAIREEMNACLRDFIERLPHNYKAVMVLSDVECFKNEEIADILGLSLDTVKIRLHRAREKLRKNLEAGCTFYRDECDELACDRKPAASIAFHRSG